MKYNLMFNLKFSYMATIKSILILNQLSNNKAVLIPSITGEYLDSETNYGSVDEPNIKFSKSEPWINFQGDSYTPIQNALYAFTDRNAFRNSKAPSL